MHVICYTVFTIYQGTGNKHSTPLFIPRAAASRAHGLDLLRGRRPLDNLHTEKRKTSIWTQGESMSQSGLLPSNSKPKQTTCPRTPPAV